MGDNNDGTSASDIITYVGVPLAVLGVMPVLYTFIVAILTQQHIKRELRRNHVKAVTRTSLMSGTVEVEHPRYSIQPLPRHDAGYWQKSGERSGIRGGSWTLFHWHKIVTGRVNYHLKLRERMIQPQAEIDFEKLITFLLDRGAVPDAEGVRLLKNMGLQTPRMTALLTTSGPVRRSILVVSNPEEAEGHLSLGLFWADELATRNEGSLPPYWARLQPGAFTLEKLSEEVDKGSKSSDSGIVDHRDEKEEDSNIRGSTGKSSESKDIPEDDETGPRAEEEEDNCQQPPPPFPNVNTPAAWGAGGDDRTRLPVRMYLGPTGLEDAKLETMDGMDIYGSFRIDHLKFQYPGSVSNVNLWFAAGAVTTLGEGHKGLWKYAIPSGIVAFARKETMPHGALVYFGLMEEEETPMMLARKDAKHRAMQDARHQEFLDGIRQRELEKKMPEAMRKQAEQSRQRANLQNMLNRQREEQRERQEEEFRQKERAVISQRVAPSVVANACLDYLMQQKYLPTSATKQSTSEAILYKMMFEEDFANRVCKILDGWKAWGEIGVMNDRHLDDLKADLVGFSYAGILLSLISERALDAQTWAGSDLAECQRVYRSVYLG